MSRAHLSQASKYWQEGQALEAGRVIFENLPKGVRPKWAADILRAIVDRTGITSPAIERILRMAGDRGAWPRAHGAFDDARDEALKLHDRSPAERLMLSQLGVAELVAKLLYNATDPDDEFDEDTGWWVAPCLVHVIEAVGDDEFARSMWSLLSAEAK